MLHFKHRLCCPQFVLCPQKKIPRAKVPLKCNFANKRSLFEDFFLKQHRALFQSWAEQCDRQPNCLIIINIKCMGFNTYCGTCNTNWC